MFSRQLPLTLFLRLRNTKARKQEARDRSHDASVQSELSEEISAGYSDSPV